MRIERRIRLILWIVIVSLVLSGITAFPIESALGVASRWTDRFQGENAFYNWINLAYQGIKETNAKYPFISYGTDWLGFAHLVIAVAFLGPLENPVRNIWVIKFGIIACLAVFPFAFIAGSIREIPVFWQLIDCSFGFFGGILLWICHNQIRQMERNQAVDNEALIQNASKQS